MQSYARIFRAPHVATLLLTTLVARLPIGINGLAVVLFLRAETGSFAVAGAAAGALALGNGAGAPVGARLIDRFGRRVLLGLAAVHATGLVGVVALGKSDAAVALLLPTAFLTGVAFPPVSSVLRALYGPLLNDDPPLVQGAFALDSIVTETIFIVGPLLVALLMALFEPAAALVVSGAAVLTGVSLFLLALPGAARDGRVRERSKTGAFGALRARGLRTLVFAMVPFGFALGALEVAVPAYADARGQREAAGLLLAVWSLGSVAGALVYGARARRASLADVHVRVALLVPLTFLPLALAGPTWTMALLLVPAGLFVAPVIATRNELAGVVALRGAETEAFTWPLTALVGGIALGAAAAGGLVELADWRVAVVASAAAAALGASVALRRRGSLEPPVPAPAGAGVPAG